MSGIWDGLQSVFSAMGSIGSLLLLGLLAVAVPTLVGWAILGPINRTAGRLKAPTRFQLSDFLWLLVQVQLVLGYCVEFVGVRQRHFFVLMLGFLALATLALWSGAVSFMSRAGVTHPPRRAIFILFLLPVTLALMMVTTLLLLVTAGTTLGYIALSRDYRMQLETGYHGLALTPIGIGVAILILPLLGYGLRRLSSWIVHVEPTTNFAS